MAASVSMRGRHFDAAAGPTPAAPGPVLRWSAPVCSIRPHVPRPRTDELAPGELAQLPRHAATEVLRPGGAGAGGSRLEPAAAAGGVVGNRGAARQAGAGATGRTIPAAGWGLRGELRGLRIGQYRQTIENPAADELGAAAGFEKAHHSRRQIRRPLRYSGDGRHRDSWRC